MNKPMSSKATASSNAAKSLGKKTLQLVSVILDHLGFGFGLHSCPGQFSTASLMKLVLCHFLLKHDLRPTGGSGKLDAHEVSFMLLANHIAQIEIRRRQEELDI